MRKIYLSLKDLESPSDKNAHYYNKTVINETIHKYILKK